jgi:hypothetical protein
MAETHDEDLAATTLPRTLWVLRFATALHKRRPSLSAAETMSIAMEEFRRQRDRPPENVADLYVQHRFD